MDADKLYQRYQELQRYVGWTPEDAQRVRASAGLLEPHLPPVVDDFYEEIKRHPDARKVLTGGEAQIQRLKGTLTQWLRELLSGPYDRDYVSRRWKVGGRHVEIGLNQVYTNVALSRVRRGLLRALDNHWRDELPQLPATRQSLNLLMDLDLAIIEDAYHAEYLTRRLNEQILQNERLAAIGQMMTGLAHESGNALARSQSCLEMLSWEVEDRPAALDLIARIQKAQDHLKHLYEEVRGYAAPLKLDREVWNLGYVWRQAWEHLALQRQGRDANLHEETGGLDLNCAVDQFRLEQVFRNILENSLAACADPVRIEVICTEAEINGHPAVRVTVRDNGPGLSPEQQEKIFEPFFTTKTKGTGLGMAIAKRIVEAHGGQIAASAAVNGGTEIQIVISREP